MGMEYENAKQIYRVFKREGRLLKTPSHLRRYICHFKQLSSFSNKVFMEQAQAYSTAMQTSKDNPPKNVPPQHRKLIKAQCKQNGSRKTLKLVPIAPAARFVSVNFNLPRGIFRGRSGPMISTRHQT